MDIYWIAVLGLIAFFVYYRKNRPCQKKTWKDVVQCGDVEFLEVKKNKNGKKMLIKKTGIVIRYNKNLWRDSFQSQPSEKTQLVMENADDSIFLRYFDDDARVFGIEATEVAMQVYQKMHPCFNDLPEQFKEHIGEKYRSIASSNLKTVTIGEVAEIFERFGLDKHLVTLVPDPMYAFNEQRKLEDPLELISHRIPGPYLQPVWSMKSTISRIYRDIISHVDWSSRPEELVDLTEKVNGTLSLLPKAMAMAPDSYFPKHLVERFINGLADDPTFKARKGKDRETEMRRIWKCRSDEEFCLETEILPAKDALARSMQEWRCDVLGDSKVFQTEQELRRGWEEQREQEKFRKLCKESVLGSFLEKNPELALYS